MKIFVIDDDPLQLEVARAALEISGYYDVLASDDPESALEMIESSSERFDLFLLDILMPGMDGVELCRRLRQSENGRSASIIMATAMSDRSHIDAAFSAGADDYVIKPFDPAEIAHRLRLARNRLLPANARAIVGHADNLFDGEYRDYARKCGLTHHSALEAYVKALDRGRTSLSMATAFWVVGWDNITFGLSIEDEDALVESCSNFLKVGLQTTTHVTSYFGGGVFVCVTKRADAVISSSLSRRLSASIKELCGSGIETARTDADDSLGEPFDLIRLVLATARDRCQETPGAPAEEQLPDLFSF